LQTIAVKLKRRSQCEHATFSANVHPARLWLIGSHTFEHCGLFKTGNISFSSELLDSIDSSILPKNSDAINGDQADVSQPESENTENDTWNEESEVHVERAGVL
jgi:hypothetical protein